MKFTHTGLVTSILAGKKRVNLFKSGKYWCSDEHKFNHVGVNFGYGTYAKLDLDSIKPIKEKK